MGDRCCMCLSVSRRRAAVTARHLQHMLLIYLDLKVVTSVCWECEARLSRLSAFRLQVEKAQRVLQQLPDPHSLQSVSSLSTLGRHHKSTFDACLIDEEEISEACKAEFSSEVEIRDTEIKLEEDSNECEIEYEAADSENEIKIDVLKYEDDCQNVDNEDDDGSDSNDDKSFGDGTEIDAKGNPDSHVGLRESYRATKLSEAGLKARRERMKADAKYSAAAHKCKTCIRIFTTRANLKQHMENLHDRDKVHVCKVCKQRYDSKVWLSSHIKAHYFTYDCNLCQYTNAKLCRIRLHYVKKHKKAGVKCNKCDLEFESYKQVVLHQRKVHEVKKVCPICGKRLAPGSYKGHVANHSKPKQPRKPSAKKECPICKQSYIQLRWHMRAHMPKKNDVVVKGSSSSQQESGGSGSEHPYCVECDRRFPTLACYQRHLAYAAAHAERKYECDDCGVKYYRKGPLVQHIAAVHVRGVRHACRYTDCKQVFMRREQLRAHLAARHSSAAPPKDKFCPYCNRGFAARRHLEHHILTHTGERPHRCPECDKGFTQKHCLTTHLLKAHGIVAKVEGAMVPDAKKRYRCHECGNSYVKRYNLKLHRWKIHGYPLYEYPNQN